MYMYLNSLIAHKKRHQETVRGAALLGFIMLFIAGMYMASGGIGVSADPQVQCLYDSSGQMHCSYK